MVLMSTALIPLPTFEGKEIRAIEHFDQVWFPVSDLAAAWGIDRSTPDKIVERNIDVFLGFTALVKDSNDVTSNQVFRAVNERGLYLMMGKISASRLKNPDAKKAIIRFQRWVPELIQKFRTGEIHQDQQLDEVVAFDLIEAKQIAKLTDTDPKILQAAILRKHGYPEIADAIRPAITHGESGWYNPTSLMKFCNDPDLTPERLNWYLKNKGFQVKDGFLWRLTPEGQKHGEEYQFNAPGGHSEPRIAWRKSVLVASGLVKG